MIIETNGYGVYYIEYKNRKKSGGKDKKRKKMTTESAETNGFKAATDVDQIGL